MCAATELPERSYYAARIRSPSAWALTEAVHKIEIRRVWENNYRCYGARRVFKALAREGHVVARYTVGHLMAELRIRGVKRGRRQFTTVADRAATRPADLVERRFVAGRPDELWLADITYASTCVGWLYVAFVLDVYSRAIVGWQIAGHLRPHRTKVGAAHLETASLKTIATFANSQAGGGTHTVGH
jgi:transposase InsO family protein